MIDPVAFSIFGLQIHWYGLLWIIGFFLARYVAVKFGKRILGKKNYSVQRVKDLCYFSLLGAIIGGRLGYVFIYGLDRLSEDFWWLFKLNQGGMSFHGGLIGVITAIYLYARFTKVNVVRYADVISLCAPIGLACGRFGNFINGELWGRATTMPWGIVFPQADDQARHPSQLYEMLGEGILLFMLLEYVSRKKPIPGLISALFVGGYGLARFLVEYFREADAHMGYYWLNLSAGQLLSLPMIIVGAGVSFYVYQHQDKLKKL